MEVEVQGEGKAEGSRAVCGLHEGLTKYARVLNIRPLTVCCD